MRISPDTLLVDPSVNFALNVINLLALAYNADTVPFPTETFVHVGVHDDHAPPS
jgi:hypothetical protein